jgi:nucleotide-binding universal stress UspA family protein
MKLPSPNWFDRILLATDGSASSAVAQKLTALVAKKFKSKVTVIHAIYNNFPESIGLPLTRPTDEEPEREPALEYIPIWWGGRIYLSPSAPEAFDKITTALKQKGTAIVTDAVAFFKKEGIEVDQRIENGDPTEAILNEAESGSYTLITIGSSGETDQKPHLGSVAKKVILHAKNSVLITRERSQISKILVPVDGSDNSRKAFEHAVVLARKTDSKMTLMNVMDPTFFMVQPEMSEEIGKKILSQAADKAEGVKVDERLERGDTAETIIRIAHDEDFDLIVMGTRGHGALTRWLIGSVSDHVTHYADRSVLLVK